MTTVHLVYPHGSSISCPDAIGRNVGQRLREHYQVILYDWDRSTTIQPGSDDVLVGHPHPSPHTCFRQSARQCGWKRVIAFSPFLHGDEAQVAFIDSVLPQCDLYLAITGNYWFASTEHSLFAHWKPKMVHVDLAVDRTDFPVVKRTFNPPGQRRFVYIGHTAWYKNTSYLTAIARAAPEIPISWIGNGAIPIEGLAPLGFQNFAADPARQVVASHDFLLTVGRADANPTTILEAMAWGLIPVCTPQSGYIGYPGIVNIPLDDVQGAVNLLRSLQTVPDAELQAAQATNWQALKHHFNWERVTEQVVAAIESNVVPPLGAVPPQHRLRIRWAALTSPYSPWQRRLRGLRHRVTRAGSPR